MRGLYNGFDSYVSKVSTLLNYIPALQSQIGLVEVSSIHALIAQIIVSFSVDQVI